MKRYKLTTNKNIVIDTETGAFVPTEGTWQSNAYQEWLTEGNEPDPIPSPTFEDYVAQFTPGLQSWMEDVAKSNAYDSVLSCVSYKDDEVQQFANDAMAMRSWRSALWQWAAAYQVGANGELPNPLPTLAEIIAQAPQPEQFGWVVHTPGQIIEAQAPQVETQ